MASLEELKAMKKKGLSLIDGKTGKPLDFAELEEKSKDEMYRMMMINDTHRLTKQLAETMLAISAAQQTMIDLVRSMQEDYKSNMDNQSVKRADIKIEPIINMPEGKMPVIKPEIRAEIVGEPTKWEHRVVESTPTGDPIRIESIPIKEEVK